jgi:hypothetical protein
MRRIGVAIVCAALGVAGAGRVSGGQMFPQAGQSGQLGRQPGIPQKPGQGNNPADPDPMDNPHRAEQQEKLRNADRQKRLVADTEKLLTLATDLKAQVDKSTKDTMSVDVIKKADEIEKLAHSVKERMKG